MSICNPWREARLLRERVADLESELRAERAATALLRRRLASAQPRDPKTGRMLPKEH